MGKMVHDAGSDGFAEALAEAHVTLDGDGPWILIVPDSLLYRRCGEADFVAAKSMIGDAILARRLDGEDGPPRAREADD